MERMTLGEIAALAVIVEDEEKDKKRKSTVTIG